MYEIRNRSNGNVIAVCPNAENAQKVFKERFLDKDLFGIFLVAS
jgi:hypothetical protein